MHLYQYLPGQFKATSHPENKMHQHDAKTNKGGSVDLTASTSKSSQSKPIAQPRPFGKPQRTPPAAFGRRTQARINNRHNQNNPYPITVGQGYSESQSVTSEITTPTTLTCPKVGPGFSDTLSVNSDLTIPTVMPGAVPEEELADVNEWHDARVRAAAEAKGYSVASRSSSRNLMNRENSLSMISENSSEEPKSVTFDKSTKECNDSEVDRRLQLLQKKSLRKLVPDEEEPPRRRSRSAPRMGRPTTPTKRPTRNCVSVDKPSITRTPSEMMEEVVLATLMHLEEQTVCSDEQDSSEASPKEERRPAHPRDAPSVRSDSSNRRSSSASTKSRRGRSISSVDRSQTQTFSFVW